MSRSDPIRERYFKAVERADGASDWLFYVSAVLSILSLLVERAAHPVAYAWLMGTFAAVVIALFVMGLVSRLYLTPRAEDVRRKDFFTSACGVRLTHEKTDGYYNNDLSNHIGRLAAQVLENSLFTRAISLQMVRRERVRVVAYALVWLVCLLYRQPDLGIVVAVSQAIFSEQLLSKWLRLEWLNRRSDKTFQDVYRLFTAKPAAAEFRAMALDSFTLYETSKANAGITLSSNDFDRLNAELSAEWVRIKSELKI